MKANAIKVMLAIVAMLTITNLEAANKKTVYNNDTIENGLVVAREVCAEDNGIISLVSRSEMTYTEDGQVSVKRDFVWNAAKKQWDFQRSYTYSYEGGMMITVVDAQGNSKVFDYRNAQ